MALDDGELSPDEQRLAAELARLAVDPSPERRRRILTAVRAAPAPRPALLRPWRVAIAVAAALVLLAAGAAGALAASSDALPNSPNYPLRSIGERVRLALADPAGREQLRISFAQSRIAQARTVLKRDDRSNARSLLRDSRAYLGDAQQDLHNVPSGEQGTVQNQLNQAQAQQDDAEGQLNQQGEQGRSGGWSAAVSNRPSGPTSVT